MFDVELREVVVPCTEDGRKNVAMFELRLGTIAMIQWEVEAGDVYRMWVAPERRREGIMTRLWHEASARGARHSAWRTDDGDAFAQSVGGQLPERRRA